MSEVVKFPRENKRAQYPNTIEAALENTGNFEKFVAEDISICGLEDFMNMISARGITIDPEESTRDMLLVLDAMRAFQYRIMGETHALHEYSDEVYKDAKYTYPDDDLEEYEED